MDTSSTWIDKLDLDSCCCRLSYSFTSGQGGTPDLLYRITNHIDLVIQKKVDDGQSVEKLRRELVIQLIKEMRRVSEAGNGKMHLIEHLIRDKEWDVMPTCKEMDEFINLAHESAYSAALMSIIGPNVTAPLSIISWAVNHPKMSLDYILRVATDIKETCPQLDFLLEEPGFWRAPWLVDQLHAIGIARDIPMHAVHIESTPGPSRGDGGAGYKRRQPKRVPLLPTDSATLTLDFQDQAGTDGAKRYLSSEEEVKPASVWPMAPAPKKKRDFFPRIEVHRSTEDEEVTPLDESTKKIKMSE
jgi:hypothetical protein